MKQLNLYIFLLLSIIFLVFYPNIKFSTNFLELFFSKESTKFFNVISKLGISNNIYIAKKGFSDDSLDELYEISKKLENLPQISEVKVSLLPSLALKNYYKQNYYLLADFNNTKLSSIDVKQKLIQEYTKLQDSFIYIPIDTNDPLGLFKAKIFSYSRYLKLKDYGYAIRAKTNIDTSSAKEARVVYDAVNLLVSQKNDMIAYAPFFFLVENSSYIQSDTQKIVILATILLLIIYFLMLKNYKILFHTVIAIGSSSLSAILASALFLHSINILVLAFGISITTVSIDYMFHYYFHGDFSKNGFIKQKSVFFGFATTFGVFIIFCFIDIKLFNQLAFFSAISLLSAYLIFSFCFGYLKFEKPLIKQKKSQIKTFNPVYVFFISLILFAYSYHNLKFDDNLRNLDYKNEKLLDLSEKFKDVLGFNDYQNIIIVAKTKELLLQKYEQLIQTHPDMLGIGNFIYSDKKCQQKIKKLKNYDFENLKEIINFEVNGTGFVTSFDNCYAGVRDTTCNMEELDDMGFKIIQEGGEFYTVVLIPKTDTVIFENDVKPLEIAQMLSKDMQDSKNSIKKFMFISIIFILIMLFIFSGLDILYPLVFVLFPLSVVMFFISLFGTINIMHLFAIIILMAISIDYGVYMHNTTNIIETKMAIKYALFSTLAGFGMLIFSDTVALHSIGFVISVGIGAIFILLYGREYENI
jgi:predicted RND superfamily exporter protein